MNHRRRIVRREHQLPLLAGLLLVLSLVYVLLSAGSVLADLPQIGIPIGVSVGLAAYSERLLRGDYDVEQVKRIAIYGWAGAVSTSFGVWGFVQLLQRELAVTLLLDEALTVVSIGSGLGLFVGAHAAHEYSSTDRTTRERLLAETVWTNEPEPAPILTAIATKIAELEGVDPVEMNPLDDHIDPDVFTELRRRDDSQWQISFHTEEYEIRVSSHGTVTIYDAGPPDEGDTASAGPPRNGD